MNHIKGKHTKFTQEDIEFIKNNYSKIGPTECAKILDKNQQAIRHFANIKLEIKISKELKSKIAHMPRKVSKIRKVPLEPFLNVKTPEVAYILGLLWADGYVRKWVTVLQCREDDALEYIKIFNKTGEWTFSKPYRRKNSDNNHRSITTHGKHIQELLYSYGYKAKSYESADLILSKIPKHLHCYWFRGYFDGDGHIIFDSKKRCQFSIAGHYDQNWKFMEDLCKALKITYKIRKDYQIRDGTKMSHSSFCVYNKDGTFNFFNYIYNNIETDKIGLSRKYNKWFKIKDYILSIDQKFN